MCLTVGDLSLPWRQEWKTAGHTGVSVYHRGWSRRQLVTLGLGLNPSWWQQREAAGHTASEFKK